ncbi:MAG TPA: hypothetical protein VFZ63_16260 [Jiangellaceae bacterium]
MALSDLLQRLRPAGAPGGAAAVAVPAEEEDPVAAELAPVFEALASVLAECDRIRTSAEQAAADEIARARREAEVMVADATSRVPAERAAAAAMIHRSGDAAADALLAEAQQAAARLRTDGAQRVAELTERVVANIRAAITARAGPPEVKR